MSGPTPFLPFLGFSEAKCLEQVSIGRIGGLSTAQDFFDLLLADGSDFAGVVHGAPGNWGHEEESWEVDGQHQFEGLLRKMVFYSPIRGPATEATAKTLVTEEQRFHSPNQSSAVLEIRRFLRDVPDADKFVVVIRLVISLDGFAANLRVLCGVHFFKRCSRAREIRDAAVRAYKLSFERWSAVVDRYARKQDDGVWGRPRWRKSIGKEKGRPGAGGSEKPRSASLVPVLTALRSSVGSSNSLQLDKCHAFLGQHIYLTRHFTKAILGEEPGDLVLEEREWALSDRANAFEDLEDTRSMVSRGSSLDHAGYVDFPAGLPAAQWARMNDRMVRWLLREGGQDAAGGGGGGGAAVAATAVAAGGASTPASAGGSRWDQEMDPVQQKWLEQLKAMERGDGGGAAAAAGGSAASGPTAAVAGRENVGGGSVAGDGDAASEFSELSTLRSEGTVTGSAFDGGAATASVTAASDGAAADAKGGSGNGDGPSAEVPAAAAPETGVGVSKASSVPYTVEFRGRRLGLQLRELHGIPVVGGLQGYDPDGSDASGGGDGDDDGDDIGGGGGGGGDGGGDDESYHMETMTVGGHSPEASHQGLFEDFQSVLGGSHGGGGAADEMMTLYGGTATETSSILASDLAEQDVTVKCIVECPQVFGPGVKKLWRWRPGAAWAAAGGGSELAEDPAAALPIFHRGLALRLGFGGEIGSSGSSGGVIGSGGPLLPVPPSPPRTAAAKAAAAVTPQAVVVAPAKDGGRSLSPPRGGRGSSEETAKAGVSSGGSSSGTASGNKGGGGSGGGPGGGGPGSGGPGGGGGSGSGQAPAAPSPPLLRVSYLDPEVGEMLELDVEAWGDFLDLKSKRLFVAVAWPELQTPPIDDAAYRKELSPAGAAAAGETGDETKDGAEAKEGQESSAEVAAAAAAAGELGSEGDSGAEAKEGGRGNDGSDAAAAEAADIAPDAAAGGHSSADATENGSATINDDDASLAGQMAVLRTRLERVSPSPRHASPPPFRVGDKGGAVAKGDGSSSAGNRNGDTTYGGAAAAEQNNGGEQSPLGATAAEAAGSGRGGGNNVADMDAGAGLAQAAAERRPCIGAVLVSVNGVRTQALSFGNVVELLTTQRRPIVLEFVDSWDQIFHSHLMETEVREKISPATFEQKMRHPLAAKLRKQIDEYMTAFRDQDLKALMSEAAERERERQRRRVNGSGGGGAGGDEGADAQQSPAGALWSLVRWLEQELPDVGIFSNSHRAGGGLPVMGEQQWNDVRQHLERFIFEQVFDECLAASPDYGKVDAQVTERLASLRFLKPRHWCVDFLDDGAAGDGGGAGREWELAQRELCRVIECRCPRDMIDCVTACVRLIALSVEASLQRRHSESAGGGATKKKKAIAVGADDLLAALTWVVVQANPPRLASRLWYMSYYMRDAARSGGGEGGYCLTQLASALQFARAADASVLADVTQAQLEEGLARHSATQAAIRSASTGDRDAVEKLLFEGADPNELSSDQQHTILTAAVAGSHLSVIRTVLQHPATDTNVRVCPNFGRRRGRTALMLAAENGDMAVMLALLGRVGSEGRAAVDADGLNAVDFAKTTEIASVLLADPANVTLCQAAKAGSLQYVKALLLQGQDPNANDASGQFTPLISATLLGNMAIVETLLGHPACDADKRNARGETALMYAVQREGHATPDSQVAAAVALLAHGADRYARDRDGRTALDWAERYGSARLADVIRVDPRQVEIYSAAKERDVRAVMALLEQGVDPNSRCPVRDFTALIASVFNKDEDMVRALLQHPNTDPNRPGKHGMTPLMYAGQAGHERMVCLLLQLKADRYRLNERGESALEMAAVRGYEVVVNILKFDPERLSICVGAASDDWPAVQGLVAQGVSVNARHRVKTVRGWQHDCYTPLIASCAAGHTGLARRLLEWEVLDMDLPNLLGQTALMYAAARGIEELVLALLAAECDRYAQDGAGRTALHWAEACGHRAVVPILRVDPKRLLMPAAAAAGATEDVWALMRQGVAPDEARNTDMEELFKAQIKAAAPGDSEELSRRANFYRSSFEPVELALSPLAAAAIFGRVAVAAMLLDGAQVAGVSAVSAVAARTAAAVAIDAKDPLGRTPLMQAARFGSEDIVLQLLSAGANRYKRDKQRKTAAELAIAAGHLGIAGIISADPERVDLIDVAAEGKLVLVDGLIKQGVPVDYCHPDKRHAYGTPLIAAAANARGDVVRLLLQKLPERDHAIAVDRPNARGETALMVACGAGALGIARQLLTAGADKTRRDRKNLSAEHHAYSRKGHVNMVLVKALFGVS